MSKKKKLKKLDLDDFFVYSTNPDFNIEQEDDEDTTVEPGDQRLLVRKERKGRGGKVKPQTLCHRP